MYDLVIIGGGPAGVAAGVYAARKRLKTALIAEMIGGQSTDSADIQNWIGTPHLSGLGLAKALEAHVKEYANQGLDLKIGERATLVERTETGSGFSVTTGKSSYLARAVLVAAGGSRKKLEVPGASELENKGVTYCASCDGPLFAGQDVVVVGGGNAGFESASQLLAYCKSVTLLSRSDYGRADAATVEAVAAHPNFKGLQYTVPTEVKAGANGFASSIVVKNSQTGETAELPAAGIFVEIGMVSNTGFVKDLVALDEWGRVKVDAKSQRAFVKSSPPASDARRGESGEEGVFASTATEPQRLRNDAGEAGGGIWAAGDCSDGLYHQNNIAAGDAVKALEDIYYYLAKRDKQNDADFAYERATVV